MIEGWDMLDHSGKVD